MPALIVISLLFILFLVEQYRAKEPGFFNYPLDLAVLALLLAYIISLIAAVDIRSGILGFMKYAASVMVFWMCYRVALRAKGYLAIITTTYLAGAIMALAGILIYCGILHYPFIEAGDRIAGLLEYSNTFGIYAAVVSILGWGLIIENKNKFIKSALSCGNAGLILAMLGSLSRGTLLLYPFALLLFVFIIGKGRRLQALANLLIFLIPALIMGRLFLTHTPTPDALIYIILGMIIPAVLQFGLDYFLAFWTRIDTKRNRLIAGIVLSTALITGLIISLPTLHSLFTQSLLSRVTTISLQEQDVQLRFEFNRDALKIVKDHPIIGVGAGGWAALYHQYSSHLYWSDKTHNFYLQTWLETGTIGILALTSVWIILICLLWKVWRQKNPINNSPLFWSIAVSVLLLGAHAFIDFDLSYPAISILMFGLMGALKGQALSVDSCSKDREDSKPAKKKRKDKEALIRFNREAFTALALGIIGSVILIIMSISFITAGVYFKKAQLVMNQDPNQFISALNSAIQLDPLNVIYYEQGAVFWASIAESSKNPEAYKQFIRLSEKSLELAPFNLRVLNNINQVYSKMGEFERSVKVGELLVKANPQYPATWDTLANSYVSAGLTNLDSGQKEKARSYWNEALKVKNRLPANLNGSAVWLNLTDGEALLLLGQIPKGQEKLTAILTEAELASKGEMNPQYIESTAQMRRNARIWLAALSEVSGNTSDSQKLLEHFPVSEKESAKTDVERVKAWLEKANF